MDVKDQRTAQQLLNQIIVPENNWKIVHYACKGFDEIRAIAIYSFQTNQTIVLKLADYTNEKEFFDAFFDYIKEVGDKNYLHWNLNSTLFGFEAIVDRYHKITNGLDVPVQIVNEERMNIAKLLKKYYGYTYLNQQEVKLPAEKAQYDFWKVKKTDYQYLRELNPRLKEFAILADEKEVTLLAQNTNQANEKVEQSVYNKVLLFKEIIAQAQKNQLQTSLTNQLPAPTKGLKLYQSVKKKLSTRL